MLSADGTQLQVFDINSGHRCHAEYVGKFVQDKTMKCIGKPTGTAGTLRNTRVINRITRVPLLKRQVAGTMAVAFAEAMDRCRCSSKPQSCKKNKTETNVTTTWRQRIGFRYRNACVNRHVQCWWKPVPPLRGHDLAPAVPACRAVQTTCNNSERVIPGMNAMKEVKRYGPEVSCWDRFLSFFHCLFLLPRALSQLFVIASQLIPFVIFSPYTLPLLWRSTSRYWVLGGVLQLCCSAMLLIFLSFLVIPMMCAFPWAWYQICRLGKISSLRNVSLIFSMQWCDYFHRLAVSSWGDPCTAALSFPTAKVAAIGFQEQANEAGGVWNQEYGKARKGMERVQVKLLLACTIQYSWPLLTDSPQFFFHQAFLPPFVLTASTLFSAPLKFSNKLSNFHFLAFCQVSHTTADDLKLLATNKTLQALQTRKRRSFGLWQILCFSANSYIAVRFRPEQIQPVRMERCRTGWRWQTE